MQVQNSVALPLPSAPSDAVDGLLPLRDIDNVTAQQLLECQQMLASLNTLVTGQAAQGQAVDGTLKDVIDRMRPAPSA